VRGTAFVRRARGRTVVTTVLPPGSVATVVPAVLETRGRVAALATLVATGLETGSLAALVRRPCLAGLVAAVLDAGSGVAVLVRRTRLATVVRTRRVGARSILTVVTAVLDAGRRLAVLVRRTGLATVLPAGTVVVATRRARRGVVVGACALGAVRRTILPGALGGTVAGSRPGTTRGATLGTAALRAVVALVTGGRTIPTRTVVALPGPVTGRTGGRTVLALPRPGALRGRRGTVVTLPGLAARGT
jgi:hypothetical protein